jgi:hypothetical protein
MSNSKKKLAGSGIGRGDLAGMLRVSVSLQRVDHGSMTGAWEVHLLAADWWGKPLLDRLMCVCWTYDEAAKEVPEAWKLLESIDKIDN